MRMHYIKEYKSCNLEVYEFSLVNILNCMKKDHGKKIAFLMTGSMAYGFSQVTSSSFNESTKWSFLIV
jgi:hypothetical protein